MIDLCEDIACSRIFKRMTFLQTTFNLKKNGLLTLYEGFYTRSKGLERSHLDALLVTKFLYPILLTIIL